MIKQKESFFNKLKHNEIFKNQFFLTISMIWGFINCIYNGLIAYYDTRNTSNWSWFYGLVVWFGILGIIKLILLISSVKMVKEKKHANFINVAIVYLFINIFQIGLITITPKFVTTVFASKLHAITITNLVTNLISCFIFISSWTHISKDKFRLDEYSFLKAKQYVGRSEGLFTILLLLFNIVMILIRYGVIEEGTKTNNIIANIYLGTGISFILGNLIAGIWLCKTPKFKIRK